VDLRLTVRVQPLASFGRDGPSSPEVREEFAWRDRERASELNDVFESYVSLASFDSPYIVAVQVRAFSQRLL